jgi:REP element-mobilizing transposase RayT
MARSLRLEYPGAFYHVMARGNSRALIFRDDRDRTLFVQTLGEACQRTGWQVHAWVLMGNHYHLVVETPEPNLVAGMKWLQNAYTRRFNARHRHWGRVFGDRYKAVPIEGEGNYYETLLDYVHLNPVRAGLVKVAAGASVRDFPWSSLANGYAIAPRQRPPWLAAAAGLARLRCADTAVGRRAFIKRLDDRAAAEPRSHCGVPERDAPADRRRSDLRHGWYWGSQAFADKLLGLLENVARTVRGRTGRGSLERRAHDLRAAQRLLAEGMKKLGVTTEQLASTPGSEANKVALANHIFENTTVSMQWLSEQLHMRSAANASQQIRRHRAAKTLSSRRHLS